MESKHASERLSFGLGVQLAHTGQIVLFVEGLLVVDDHHVLEKPEGDAGRAPRHNWVLSEGPQHFYTEQLKLSKLPTFCDRD